MYFWAVAVPGEGLVRPVSWTVFCVFRYFPFWPSFLLLSLQVDVLVIVSGVSYPFSPSFPF